MSKLLKRSKALLDNASYSWKNRVLDDAYIDSACFSLQQSQKEWGFIMKFVIQRVTSASVTTKEQLLGEIQKGFLVLICISQEDTREIADKLVRKMIGLRIFEDGNGKTNLSLGDVCGSLLLVSQFTLYADCKKGNRPSFTKAGSPDMAEELYEYIISACKKQLPEGGRVETGSFGAEMAISLVNDGPFTIVLDSAELCG